MVSTNRKCAEQTSVSLYCLIETEDKSTLFENGRRSEHIGTNKVH